MPHLSIINHAAVPDDTAGCYLEPYTVAATNDTWKHLVLVFEEDTAAVGLYGIFTVPADYSSGANLVIVWTSTATAGDVEWDFIYRAVGGNDNESLDQATAQESVNSNDTAPSAANERMEITIALTDGNFAAEDTVEFYLSRDGADAGDTMSADALLFEALFEYTAA